MDINEAKQFLSSNDITQIKQALEYLKTDNDINCVDSLKTAKNSLPIYETALIEEIDNLISDITKKALAANAPVVEAAVAAENNAVEPSVPADSMNNGSVDVQSAPAVSVPENSTIPLSAGDKNSEQSNVNPGEFPKNEYLDKVKVMWEKGKDAAIKNATILRLKSQLNTIKNDKLVQLKHLGEKTYDFFKDKEVSIEFIKDQINKIKELEARLAKYEAEEKELENAKAEGSIWNILKAKMAKILGYTQIKLNISIFKSEREGKIASFGQLLYDKLAECESVLKQSQELIDILGAVANLEKQRQEKEVEINEISAQQ